MGSEVEDVKSRLNIVDVLGEYIRLEKAGSNFKAVCPFHNEKTPSFMVSEERQMWHCFGCGKGGDIFSFVMEMDGLDFRGALKLLAEKAGVEIKSFAGGQEKGKEKPAEILEEAVRFWEKKLWKDPAGEKILKYLQDRGLSDNSIRKFRLGYAPDGWRNILELLAGKGYSIRDIARSGILVERSATSGGSSETSRFYDRFRDRIIFPISDYSGRVIGVTARVAPGGDESQAKYVNTPETPLYHKSRVLYGLDKAKAEIKRMNWALLVEGNMDVIACHQAGLENAVAVSGTALTEEQVTILKRYTNNLKMFFDMDNAGEAATRKSAKLCASRGMNVKVVTLPQGKDAADLALEGAEKLKEAVGQAQEVVAYFFQKVFSKFDKKEAAGKKRITADLLDVISGLENEVEKSHWIKRLAEDLDVSEMALTEELKKANLEGQLLRKKEEPLESSEKILTKEEFLLRDLAGLVLSSGEIWKKALEKVKAENMDFSQRDPLVAAIFEKGESCGFSFENFLQSLGDNLELKNAAEEAFAKRKFQLDLNNNPEERDTFADFKDLSSIFRDIKKQDLKKNLTRLASDLKLAESKNDKEAIRFLRQESAKIVKKLGKISE